MYDAQVIFFALMVLGVLGTLLLHWAYWHVGIDKNLLKAFKATLLHEYYYPFNLSDNASYKIQLLNELKENYDQVKAAGYEGYNREYLRAAHEVLGLMRYKIKLMAAEQKAMAIVEKMKK